MNLFFLLLSLILLASCGVDSGYHPAYIISHEEGAAQKEDVNVSSVR